jgi:hypothetical protein
MPTYHREFGRLCGKDDPVLEQIQWANRVLAHSKPQTRMIESAEAGWASIDPAGTAQLVSGAYI